MHRRICLAFLASLVLLAACTPGESSTTSASPPSALTPLLPTRGPGDTSGEMMVYPSGYLAYRDYVGVIGGKPPIADTGVIEATVVAIQQADVCPFQEEKCSIEPYPDDWGTVQVDRIVAYTPFAGQDTGSLEQPAEGKPQTGKAVGGYVGSEPETKRQAYDPLQGGQQVQAHFLLSTRPAKARRLPVSGSEDEGSTQSREEGAQRTAGQVVQVGEKAFRPIPREGEHWVFVIGVGEVDEASDQVLPGLVPGTRFRADIWYDGVLHIERYKVIP